MNPSNTENSNTTHSFMRIGKGLMLHRKSLIASLIKDLCTFAVIGLCVYVSRDSSWWTFVTGLAFIFIVFRRLKYVFDTRVKRFKTKQELIDFLNND